ncbi:hypothetical protein LTR53_011604 [Teratosphaeriaceae sp. CCFEE 6253]|nr:hypothetical protein LTR53_011604 [Teratosphaeriaceae sp. CCFEE 6253]
MDTGHFNCRDYIHGLHFAPTTLTATTTAAPHLPRHESWTELEHRSRSPASFAPKFPLLRLPLELRQQILLYLLPYTRENIASDPLARHAATFSAVQKRSAKGLVVPTAEILAAHHARTASTNIIWHRGLVTLLRVNRQLHAECAELLYGRNTFLLFLTYADIKWRYRWLLPSGQAPSRNYPFLELLPDRYRGLLRRVVVCVDHVDAYTGMIKWNVGGKGLTYGLRRQVQRLVTALTPAEVENDEDGLGEERCLTHLSIRVSNSAVSEALPRRSSNNAIKSAAAEASSDDNDLQIILDPFRQLYGCRSVSVSGAVTAECARELEACLRSPRPTVTAGLVIADGEDAGGLAPPVMGLCVYGNDI